MLRWLIWRAKLNAGKLITGAGLVIKNWSRIEPYGFTAKPPTPATAYLLSPNGNPANSLAVIVENNDSKPTINAEEVALWNKAGAIIRLKANGNIHITGNLHITGDLTTDSKPGGYNTHTHTGDSGGNTSPPRN